MKYFRLGINYAINHEWRALLPPSEDEAFNLLTKLDRGEKLWLDRPLMMVLRNIISVEEGRNEIPFKSDLIYWLDDITLQARIPEKGVFVIISEKLKNLLLTFSLPDYEVSEINLINIENREEVVRYYLLYIYGNIHQQTNYGLCEYTFSNWHTDEILKVEKGIFNDQNSFAKLSKEVFDQEKIDLRITKRYLNVNYDLMWGIANHIYVNEKVKEAINSSDIYGVKFTPFKDYEIVPSSEYL